MEKIKKIVGWFLLSQMIPLICGVGTSFGDTSCRYFTYIGFPDFWAGYSIGIILTALTALIVGLLYLIIVYLL